MHETVATTTGDHVAQNRAAWDRMATDYVESGRRNWASDEVSWGIFDVPESRIGMLPSDLAGIDTVELGCGTGYVSAWLARRGARPVGIDNSPAQLETARRIPEAARILRTGGRLSFLGNSVLLMLTTPLDDEDAPASEQLQRPLFGMYRFAWEDGAVEFHLPHGEMIRLLRDSGFEVEDLVEVEIAPDATTRYPFVSPEWARRWPADEVWKARKR